MAGNNRITNHSFHANTTTADNGTEYVVTSNADEMNLFFKISSGGTFTAIVEGYDYDTAKWYLWDVYQIPTYTECSGGITDDTKAYNISLKGIDKIRVRLTAVTSTFSCYGKAVG
jgi:hypothetical protein